MEPLIDVLTGEVSVAEAGERAMFEDVSVIEGTDAKAPAQLGEGWGGGAGGRPGQGTVQHKKEHVTYYP
jgi:hypothetical protein